MVDKNPENDPVPGLDRDPLARSPGDPLPARPARRRGLVLANQPSDNALEQRLEPRRAAFRRLTSGSMAHWRQVRPLEWLDLDYETLVGDLEGQSRRLIEFLGLEWDPACLSFHQNRRVVTNAQPRAGPPAGLRRFGGHLAEVRAVSRRAFRSVRAPRSGDAAS